MGCNNGIFGGNNDWIWIIIAIIIVLCLCNDGLFGNERHDICDNDCCC